jgi:hypothetical protein
MKKAPPRLVEALGHIQQCGSLMPMDDLTMKQIDRLWDHIHHNKLATMTRDGGLTWDLTQAGLALAHGETVK